MYGELITMSEIKHDLDHEVYLDPKDEKEHINHGMLEYKKSEVGRSPRRL